MIPTFLFKRQCLLVTLLLLVFLSASGQNNEILKELEKANKRKSGSSSSSSYTSANSSASTIDGIFFLFDVFYFFGEGIVSLQQKALSQRPDYREITSIEGSLNGGYYTNYNAALFAPQIRGNWGIFSTDFRYQRIDDRSNILETYDWQVLKLNVPIKNFKASFGMGFTRIPQVNTSYFEYSIGGQLRCYKERILAEVSYRQASEFRQEMKMSVDYEVKSFDISDNSKIHISPMIGFNYQNYYDQYSQYYFLAGVNLRLY